MLPIDKTSAYQPLRDSALDTSSLDKIKAMGRDGDPQALREMAKQFEALFVQQMLKQMRATNEVFAEDGWFNSSEMRLRQDMLDQQMSLTMSSGRGIGLADAFYEQMLRAYGDQLPTAADVHNTGASNATVAQAPLARTAPTRTSAQVQPVSGGKTTVAASPAEFVEQLTPYAREAAEQLNVNADVLLAQAALETGWGRHVIHTGQGDNSFNLFNIKADRRWDGDKVNVNTLEYRDGAARQERADFRRYNSYAESFADYVSFLQTNPRYQLALAAGENSQAYAQALQDAGYATDPAYAEKIQRLLDSDPIRAAAQTLVAAASQVNEG